MNNIYWRAFIAQLVQVAISFDQVLCAVAGFGSLLWAVVMRDDPPCTHMADETMSAMLWRKHRDRKPWGLLLMRPVDLVFSLWQRDEDGRVVHNHCYRAYQKERDRKNLPAEYTL